MDTLTEKQRKVLDVIQAYLHRYGFGPTLDEIAEDAGLGSGAAALWHVRALERKGRIQRFTESTKKGPARCQTRSITLLDGIE